MGNGDTRMSAHKPSANRFQLDMYEKVPKEQGHLWPIQLQQCTAQPMRQQGAGSSDSGGPCPALQYLWGQVNKLKTA